MKKRKRKNKKKKQKNRKEKNRIEKKRKEIKIKKKRKIPFSGSKQHIPLKMTRATSRIFF